MYIKPRIVVIEETEHWDKELVEQAGKIYGVYLFDANREVYCCELTPSRELTAFESAVQKWVGSPEEVREEIEDKWQRYTDSITYMHVGIVDHLTTTKLPTVRCKAAEYVEVWDDLVEDYRANVPSYALPED